MRLPDEEIRIFEEHVYGFSVQVQLPGNAILWMSRVDCGYRKFEISRNSGAPPAIVTEIVAEMVTLGLGNVRETRRCPRKKAHCS
jgi:hypothetical protein